MLTHVDEKNLPTMVDVTDKLVSARIAVAQSIVQLPEAIRKYLQDSDHREIFLKKGPVFQTAIIAGTMATKKTHELIPFCHQVPVESCKIAILLRDDLSVLITCRVKTTFKTGVEMEAIHGAMTAALTVYDMCKAVSHDIVIRETKLLAKQGGRRRVLPQKLYGLVLTGGRSSRMNSDKALLAYHDRPQAQFVYEELQKHCEGVYLSAREGQWAGTALEKLPIIADRHGSQGPLDGIVSAFETHPDAAWLVVACDLPFFNSNAVETLLDRYDDSKVATCYRNLDGAFSEPLCTVYSPGAYPVLSRALAEGRRCPTKILETVACAIIDRSADSGIDLSNANTPEEFSAASRCYAMSELDSGQCVVQIKYFALFRELAGVDVEAWPTTDLNGKTYAQLYEDVAARYGFKIPVTMIQIAVDDEFARLDQPVSNGARVVFIPPVAGG